MEGVDFLANEDVSEAILKFFLPPDLYSHPKLSIMHHKYTCVTDRNIIVVESCYCEIK